MGAVLFSVVWRWNAKRSQRSTRYLVVGMKKSVVPTTNRRRFPLAPLSPSIHPILSSPPSLGEEDHGILSKAETKPRLTIFSSFGNFSSPFTKSSQCIRDCVFNTPSVTECVYDQLGIFHLEREGGEEGWETGGVVQKPLKHEIGKEVPTRRRRWNGHLFSLSLLSL
jgi:hypothetical protein